MIDTSSVGAPSRGVPDLFTVCARTDIWGLSEVSKALCGTVGSSIKSRGRPVCFCSRFAPDGGDDIGCALSGKQ